MVMWDEVINEVAAEFPEVVSYSDYVSLNHVDQ